MSSIADFEFNASPLSEGVIPCRSRCGAISRLLTWSASCNSWWTKRARRCRSISLRSSNWMRSSNCFTRLGFGGASGVYRLSDAIWLDKVLEARQGTPVSLGTIFLHIANALDLPLLPVIFPTQLILRADWLDEELWLINPLNGETLSEHQLEVWIKGNLGLGAELEDDDLDESENIMVVRKMLDTLKAALMEEKQLEMALRTSETVLCFDPEDPYEIRDRGLIYAQLECNHIAISDLNYFVEQCPEDPVSEVIKVQIHSIEPKQVTLH